jgi:asparagine synthase (glutamine-hydrolysing)
VFDAAGIHAAVTSLIHRGPDQQGVFQSSFVSLGATRLKVIDPTAGDQPLQSASGDTTLVFNGEIYNHAELRRELEQRGHRFRTVGDTEVVLEAFLEWDVECFSRFRGMFAIALWTESARRLVLARDRIGIKPLYVARKGGDLFFGSEIKAILVHAEFERQINLAGLDCYLSLNYSPGASTLVEGIDKLLPGQWLEWRNGKVRTDTYWRLPFGRRRARTSEAAQEELDGLLKDSVREHLISDVPLGVWLSGGVDSSAILHYAVEQSAARLKTFSISFHGRSFDETGYIREMVSRYGTDHEQLDLNSDSGLQDAIEEFAYYSDEPNADAGALPVWFLSRMTRKSATVALSGEGADELFGGYLTYRANRLAKPMRRLPSSLLSGAQWALKHWPVSDEKISLEYKVKRFLEGCRLSPGRAHVYWNGTFSDSEKRLLTRVPLPGGLNRIVGEYDSVSDDPAVDLWFDQKYFLPDDILSKVDRISMAHAVEVRPPFLDHRIVEFAASLPMRLKVRGSHQKVVLKALMKGRLPPSILNRGKVGLDIPAHDWLRGPLQNMLKDTLMSGAREYSELFRVDRIEDCVRQHMERRANYGYHLWGLMILFLWMKKWRMQPSAVPALGQRVSEIA